jgi:hypothetical protein
MMTNEESLASEQGVYSFTLRLCGLRGRITDETQNTLFEAGCDDALLRQCDGHVFLDFDREGKSLTQAIVSAIQAVEASGAGFTVVEVIPPGSDEIGAINAALSARSDEGLLKSLAKPQ